MKAYSIETYQSLIKLALKRGYKFKSFLDAGKTFDHSIYLRHDVDYSLRIATELAKINTSLGVQGTFFLLLRSQFYNLLNYTSLNCAQEIQRLGQHVAIHYYLPSTFPVNDDQIADQIQADFEIVKRHLPGIQPVFSWHNPTPEIFNRSPDFNVPGLTSAYGAKFTKDIPYYSDSNMRHSVAQLEEVIGEKHHSALQLLLHPLIWVLGGKNMAEVLIEVWPYIVRESELEMRSNREWLRHVSDGIPSWILDNLVRNLHAARRTNNP